MPGVKGRSGGHNKIPVALHLARGTFRPARHAKAVAAPPRASWGPTEAQMRTLGEAGRAFVIRQMAAYDISVLDGELLLEAAICADRLAACRVPEAARDALEIAWQKQFTALCQALRVMATPPAAKAAPSKWAGLLA